MFPCIMLLPVLKMYVLSNLAILSSVLSVHSSLSAQVANKRGGEE